MYWRMDRASLAIVTLPPPSWVVAFELGGIKCHIAIFLMLYKDTVTYEPQVAYMVSLFGSMKKLGVILLPSGRDSSPLESTPNVV